MLTIPIHYAAKSHWALVVVDFKLRRFEYYDSLFGLTDVKEVQQITATIQRYIRDDAAAYSDITNYDFEGWSLYIPFDAPQQRLHV